MGRAVFFAAVIGFLILLVFPPESGPHISGIGSKNISNARQMGLAARDYGHDHQGQLPLDLTDCVPDYLEPSAFEELRFDPREKSSERPRPKSDWRYFGAFFDEKNPPPLLIASPQFFTVGKTNKRVVVLGDFSTEIIREPQYQKLLNKTIETMHQRARSIGIEPAPDEEATNANREPR